MDSIITTWIPGGRPPISRGPPSPPIPPPTPIPPFRPDPGKKSASTDPTPDDSDGDVSAHAAGSQLPNLPPGTDFYAPYLIRTGVQTDDNIVMRRVQRDLNTHDAAETEVLYYTVPKERFLELEVTDDSTLPYSILDGLCPELKVQFWNDEMWGPKLGDLASSQLEISSTGWSFTNYSARRTDTKTGDIVVEFCLDGLKLSYLWERHTPIRTPRGKPVIALDHERIGVVERVCVCLRRTAGSGANPRWSLDIISPFGISSYFDGFNTLMGNLNAGTLWTQLAVHDPRRLVLEIVRTMLSWRNLDEELRVKVTNTCEVMLQRASMDRCYQGPSPRAQSLAGLPACFGIQLELRQRAASRFVDCGCARTGLVGIC
ncbi:hypothetical protein BZA05DRAFT_8783 [Tricharina praecox]|uniref:uncharacterized protein n=1 Tax=Tricharina praecox TaxID=43433 RepID=UPI00221F40AD|nr:uncharacterized protein BZA05DRAFT_8783 [Tricharina praecox]KAI5858610.1 hypothetical protein BZA05DRAFT_8783 [Tricharina praecox]